MKESIPLKEIVGFLPYGLPARLSIQGLFNLDREYPNENDHKLGVLTDFYVCNGKIESAVIKVTEKTSYDVEEGDYDVFVRPLSDLTKEITHNGETFVPIVKIYELFFDDLNIKRNKTTGNIEIIMLTNDYSEEIDFFVGSEIIELLKEWHFDVYDWIKDGLAIDINTLNN